MDISTTASAYGPAHYKIHTEHHLHSVAPFLYRSHRRMVCERVSVHSTQGCLCVLAAAPTYTGPSAFQTHALGLTSHTIGDISCTGVVLQSKGDGSDDAVKALGYATMHQDLSHQIDGAKSFVLPRGPCFVWDAVRHNLE